MTPNETGNTTEVLQSVYSLLQSLQTLELEAMCPSDDSRSNDLPDDWQVYVEELESVVEFYKRWALTGVNPNDARGLEVEE